MVIVCMVDNMYPVTMGRVKVTGYMYMYITKHSLPLAYPILPAWNETGGEIHTQNSVNVSDAACSTSLSIDYT